MKKFKLISLLLLIALPFFSSGCTTTTEMEGVDVSTNFQGHGVKIFQVSQFPLYQATLEALKNMNIKVQSTEELGENFQIFSETEDLIIIIDLENVGTQISRMRVKAEEGGFFSFEQNEEMAQEIIKETALVLEARGQFNY